MTSPRSEAGRVQWLSYFDSADHRRPWHTWGDFGEVIDCGEDHAKTDASFLCTSCGNRVDLMLTYVPAVAYEVNTALLRETVFVERGDVVRAVDAEETSPLPYDPAARAALDGLARALGFRRGVPLVAIAVRARELTTDLAPVLLDPAAPAWAFKLSLAMRRCQHVIERPADVWYFGPCPDCKEDLYAERDAERVLCGCGWSATREAHQHAALDAADDTWLTVGELVGAITQAGETVTRNQINHWIAREGLAREKRSRPVWRDGKLLPRTVYTYRLGDVRALAARPDQRRKAG